MSHDTVNSDAAPQSAGVSENDSGREQPRIADGGQCNEQSGPKPSDRPCTCHPDDNPPQPCPQKYALSHCRRAEKFLDILMRLQMWRDEDHEDALVLSRSEIIDLIECAKEYTRGQPLNAETRRNDSGECPPSAVFVDPIPSPVSEAEVIERWQPIETAPKDGSGVRFLIAGTWLGKHMVRETQGYTQSTLWRNIAPTHWMPLPAPPSALSTPIGR